MRIRGASTQKGFNRRSSWRPDIYGRLATESLMLFDVRRCSSLAASTLGIVWVVPERLPTYRPMRVALGVSGATSAIIARGT